MVVEVVEGFALPEIGEIDVGILGDDGMQGFMFVHTLAGQSLESLAGELACIAATDDEIAELKAIHYEMLAAYTRKSRLEYFKLNQKIHLCIVAASRNEALIEAHNRLNARLYRFRYQSNLRGQRWHTAVEEHEEILHALVNRESERLAALMRAHLASTWSKISESMNISASTKRVNRE